MVAQLYLLSFAVGLNPKTMFGHAMPWNFSTENLQGSSLMAAGDWPPWAVPLKPLKPWRVEPSAHGGVPVGTNYNI